MRIACHELLVKRDDRSKDILIAVVNDRRAHCPFQGRSGSVYGGNDIRTSKIAGKVVLNARGIGWFDSGKFLLTQLHRFVQYFVDRGSSSG